MGEEWRSVNEMYEVSNKGRVRSLDGVDKAGRVHKGRILRQRTTPRGYAALQMHGKDFLVHRLVAQAFIPNPENKPQVNHIDGNKLNNNVENLEWATSSENNKHRYALNLHNQDGPKNPSAKLTAVEVRKIRELLINTPIKDISEMFGVCDATIYNIRRGASHKNVV